MLLTTRVRLTVYLGGVIALFVALHLLPLPSAVLASRATTISEVCVTNVRATAFTVSWITGAENTGHIIYGTSPTTLTQTTYDVRGPSFEDDTHYVTVSQLTDKTPYYFDVVSGGTTDDNGGAHYVVTTGPVLTSTAGLDTVYGQVWRADGATEAAGTIVYVTLADADGSGHTGAAAPMSALVEPNGWWSANLGNARRPDLGDYFAYSQSGDELQLCAQGAGDGEGSLTVDTLDTAPAPDMVLSGSTSIVYLPLVLSEPGGASVSASASLPRLRALGPVILPCGRTWRGTGADRVGPKR